jgi:hypothetical protein
MNGKAPDLHMLNVIVADMPASLDFYRQLGAVVPDGDVTAGAHVQLRMPTSWTRRSLAAGRAAPPWPVVDPDDAARNPRVSHRCRGSLST